MPDLNEIKEQGKSKDPSKKPINLDLINPNKSTSEPVNLDSPRASRRMIETMTLANAEEIAGSYQGDPTEHQGLFTRDPFVDAVTTEYTNYHDQSHLKALGNMVMQMGVR